MRNYISKYYRYLFISLLSLLCVLPAVATNRHVDKKETLLIINSYNENAPWIRALITPITLYVANNDDIHAEIFNIDNVSITDYAAYNTMSNSLFDTYRDRKPSYVVIIGTLGFNLRDEIKKNWGDIPILLITRDLTLAPLDYYFSGFDSVLYDSSFPSVAELRPEFNFTAIYVPDFYKATVDLIANLLPDMDELVFFSDPLYINRNLARDIEYYLLEEYPAVKFKWVQASQERPDDLQYYFVHPMPNTGMIISSWCFEKVNAYGKSVTSFGDLNIMYSSVNPIFSLRESYMDLGAIGGVYANLKNIQDKINETLDKMVSGASMRDEPFYINRKDGYTKINYELLQEYNLSTKDCPEDTIFVNRPMSFWEKYKWHMMVSIFAVVAIILLFLYRYVMQRRQIAVLTRHKHFVTSMPVPYSKAKVVYDDKGQVINVKYTIYNEAFEKLLQANAYSYDPYLIFPNEFIAQKTSEMISTNGSVSFMYHFDKTDKYYIFTLCFVDERKTTKTDVVEEIDIFAIDVTNRQKAELELKKTTQKLDMTLNVAKLIPWEWDMATDELIFDAYSMFHRIGYTFAGDENTPTTSKTVMAGIDFINLVHPDDRHILLRLRNDLHEGRADEFHEVYRIIVARNGKDVEEWVEISGAVTARDDEGKPLYVTGSFLIITERKRQEMELIDAKERASESDKMKSAFLANMSHEIRTPLNAIVGFSGLMAETDDIEKRREFADIIDKNNDMLLSLIGDILDLAKIESNTLEMNYSAVDLNALLNTVADTMRPRMKEGVRLNLVMGSKHCIIRTDGNRLSQILTNLLINAAKFTTKGNVTFGYDIFDNKELYFYVKDTGRGVALENQSRLFTRFDKLDNFEQGNGLGLAISKSLVEKLGGQIGMSSRGEGKGSTFWFTIKYEEAKDAGSDLATQADETDSYNGIKRTDNSDVTADLVSKAIAGTAAAKETHQQPAVKASGDPQNSKVILAAEDIEGNFLLLKHLIPSEYKLLHAWTGREAVDMFFEHHPDLVIMDISMPDINGYEATTEIRAIDKQVPIIAVTAYAYASDRKRILQSGFNDYVSKPITRNDLLDAIHRHLG